MKDMITLRSCVVAGLVACCLMACEDAGAGSGEEGGVCYPNGTCNEGLACLSDRCVRLPDDIGSEVHPDVPDVTTDVPDPGHDLPADPGAELDTDPGAEDPVKPNDDGAAVLDDGAADEGTIGDVDGGDGQADSCVRDCSGRDCGDDGCGGSCGACAEDRRCTPTGQCEVAPWTCRDGMCLVPAGSFWMGSNQDGSQCPTNALDPGALSDELPCHQVTIPDFWIDRDEATVADYRQFVEGTGPNCGAAWADPSCMPTTYPGCNWDVAGRENHPINCVPPWALELYCQWRGKRLCSESEWEKAARGTDGRLYPWGNQAPDCTLATMRDGDSVAGCGAGSSAPVGSRPLGASPHGVMDMAGNVAEMVKDSMTFRNYFGAPDDGSPWLDPYGPQSNRSRGGGFGRVWDLRAAHRSSASFDQEAGVRCCATGAP